MSQDLGRLKRLGFNSLPECLLCVPKEYRDCLEPLHILPIPDTGMRVYMVLTLIERTLYDRTNAPTSNWRRGWRLSMRAVDGRGDVIQVTVFGAFHPWMEFQPGDELHLFGEVTLYKERRQINNPDLVPPHHRGRVVPVYIGKPGQVSAESLSLAVATALPRVEEGACALLAQAGLRESDFHRVAGVDAESLLRSIHAPKSPREGVRAVEAAKRLTLSAILGKASRNQASTPIPESALPINRVLMTDLVARLPFDLTSDQLRAIDEVVSDLRGPYPMRRLLSGDVGTGKTLTFVLPAVAAFKAGGRVAIVVPNTLLVEQIAGEISQFFPEVPVQKVTAGVRIDSSLIVGTSAVVNAARKHDLVFNFVVIDEQHKFSVEQKDVLRRSCTNVLESTATAVPRTLALVGFGGMSVSILRQCPVVKRIDTRLVEKQDAARLFGFLERLVSSGGQVAVIYPMAEAMGEGDRMSVESAFARFKERFGEGAGMLHGKLTEQEKGAVIDRMRDGFLKVLISSTVIEVGVTLPSLKAVVVVHPDRFGVSQLHQLRGRVARKGGQGYFFMYAPSELDEAVMERLGLLVECSDGFTLAERDADMRGYGDIDAGADSQSGSSRLLFHGLKITRQEIEAEAERLGLLEAA